MATEINNFLLSLAAAIAAATSPALELANTPRSLWIHDAVEGNSTPVYTVLRIYGGSEPPVFSGMRVPSVRIQHDTRGSVGADVLNRAWKVHEALIDGSTGQSRMGWTIAGERFNADTGAVEADGSVQWLVRLIRFLTAPGIVGRDGERSIATGNFEVDFELKT